MSQEQVVTHSSSRWRTIRNRLPSLSLAERFGLVVTVLLGLPAAPNGPQPGLDMSWMAGLNVAPGTGLRFGQDLEFTYGPWGFIAAPMAIDRFNAFLGLAFTVAMIAGLWFAMRRALGTGLSGLPLVVTGSVLTVLATTFLVSTTFLIAIAGFYAYVAASQAGKSNIGLATGLSALGGFTILLKFSDGLIVLVLGILLLLTVRVRQLLFAAPLALAAFVGTFTVAWLIPQHGFTGLGRWFRSSLQMAAGYSEAMGIEGAPQLTAYIAALVATVVVVILAWRRTRGLSIGRQAATILIVLAVNYLGWKEGFIRNDVGHRALFFVPMLPLLATAVGDLKLRTRALTGLAILTLFISGDFRVLAPLKTADKWSSAIQLLFDHGYQNKLLAGSREFATDKYRIPKAMIDEIGTKPTHIDPWEASAAWTYGLNWHPVPVFQTYVAYTPALDQMNAAALESAPNDQRVLRQPHKSLDGRNPLWEGPNYQMALICDYRSQQATDDWLLLAKSFDRCASPQQVQSVAVRSGEAVKPPQVGENQVLTMSFTPEAEGLLGQVGDLIFKPLEHLQVWCGSQYFRVPRAISDGPLLVSFPDRTNWPPAFAPVTPCDSVTWNTAGTLTFSVRDMAAG